MKVLLLIPPQLGLFQSIKMTFTDLGAEIHCLDHNHVLSNLERSINVQMFRLPDKYRLKWERRFLGKINNYYTDQFRKIQPDLVFIYNNAFLLPQTIQHFKRTAKIAFFLGDNPFYTPTNRYYLALLFFADAIYSPDTFWIDQLAKMGLKHLFHMLPGLPAEKYFEKKITDAEKQELQTEVLYVGNCYTDSWGYKKACFLNHFTSFNLKIHGSRHWRRWFQFFPKLESHFHERNEYISVERLNTMYNATKVIPIDGNPGVLNGVHFRIFEALSAGVLPLLEWQNDLDHIFPKGMALPAVRSYDEINDMVRKYIDDEELRRQTVKMMRDHVAEKYSTTNNASLFTNTLNLG